MGTRTKYNSTTIAGHSTPPAVTGFSEGGDDLGDICTNTSDRVILLRLLHQHRRRHYLHPRHHWEYVLRVRVHILLTVAPAAAVALAVGKFRSYYNNIILYIWPRPFGDIAAAAEIRADRIINSSLPTINIIFYRILTS